MKTSTGGGGGVSAGIHNIYIVGGAGSPRAL